MTDTTTTTDLTVDETITRLDVAQSTWSGGAAIIARSALDHLRSLRTMAEARVALLEATLKTTNDDRIAVIEQRNKADRALTVFKDQVRDAAIATQAGHSDHLSKDALNEWLGALGLDPVVTKWNCEGTWQGMDLPSATVEADDEESALDKYRAQLQNAEVTVSLSINGEVDDTDEVVFGSNYISEENDYFSDIEFDIDDADLSAERADD
jgi:hypothetical protein